MHLLMTHVSSLIARPLSNAKAAVHFAAASAGRSFVRDWKQVLFELDGRIDRQFYWIGILALACAALFLEFVVEALVRVARPAAPQIDVASQAVALSFFAALYPTIVKPRRGCGISTGPDGGRRLSWSSRS